MILVRKRFYHPSNCQAIDRSRPLFVILCVLVALWRDLLSTQKKGPSFPGPKMVEMGFALEVYPQPEFDLAWAVELTRDVAK